MRFLIKEIVFTDNIDISKIVLCVVFIIGGGFLYEKLEKLSYDKRNMCVDKIERKVTMMIDDVNMRIKYEDTEKPVILDQTKKATTGYSQIGYTGISDCFYCIISSIIVVIGVLYIVLISSIFVLILMIVSFCVASILNGKVANVNYEYLSEVID